MLLYFERKIATFAISCGFCMRLLTYTCVHQLHSALQVQGFGTCCGYPVNGFDNGGASAPNPASGGNGVSSSGWLFSVCENGNCQALDKYAPDYGISGWFQRLWEVQHFTSASSYHLRVMKSLYCHRYTLHLFIAYP